MPSRPVVVIRDADVLLIAETVRRYVSAGMGDEPDADDITQETVARLIANRWRIDRRTAPGYAIATARSLLASRTRGVELARRHQHRLYEPLAAEDPAEVALAAEEEFALAAALDRLAARDQLILNAHHVEGISSTQLAALHSTTPGAMNARLARARGRLRLEYCLQSHRRGLPDDRCRRILTAIATGDGRRQTALGASRHIPTCNNCTTISAAVTAPDRHRAGLGVLGILAGLFALARRLVRSHPAVSAAGASVTAAAVVAVVAFSPAHPQAVPAVAVRTVAAPTPTDAPTPTPSATRTGLISGGSDLLRLPADRPLKTFVHAKVLGRSVPVLAVDANEGFWVGTSSHRVWVELATHGESQIAIKAGTLVDFAGAIEANSPGYAATVGLTKAEDSAELDRQGAHVVVPVKDIATVPAAPLNRA